MVRFIFYVVFFLGSATAVLSQEREFVTGRLMDAQSQVPISFASIQLKNKGIGLISNADGGFQIPLDFQIIGDTLLLSCIGYASKEIALSSLLQDRINTIALAEAVEKLNEVVVTISKKRKRLTAKEIVRSALKKIPENYPLNPFSYVGYYRDYQLKNESYLNLNEAILSIYDLGFNTNDLKNTKVRLHKYEENQDFSRDSISARNYDYSSRRKVIPNATINGRIGNEHTRLRLHDAIRNHNIYTYSYVNRLDIDFIKNHRFSLEEDTFINEIPLFKIKISKVIDNVVVTGNLYIDKIYFGIYKLEYQVYERNSTKYKKELFSRTGVPARKNSKLGKLLYDITVAYQNRHDKMYLDYISFSNAFNILSPPKFTPLSAKIVADKKYFELVLSDRPLKEDALNSKNYKLYYQERRLRIDKIKVNGKSVFLYPKNAKGIFNKNVAIYFKERNKNGVAIEIKGVRDIFGNLVNEREAINYNQYREFFVQRYAVESEIPEEELFMNRTSPIYENQPIVPLANSVNFWMNTPLKK